MPIYLKNIKSGDRILDLGCGNGRLLKGIEQEVKYTGVDFSATLIDEAKKIHPGKMFVCGDITKDETWKDLGKFDVIYSVAVLHHIPTRDLQLKIIDKMAEHLEDGGRIYLSVWNLWQTRFLKDHLSSMKEKIQNWRWLKVPFQKSERRFCFAFDPGYIKRLVKGTGLSVVEINYWTKEGKSGNILNGANLWVVLERSK